MKRHLEIVILALAAAFASGCTTTHRATAYNDVKVEDGEVPAMTIEIENSGWLLFGVVPLGSGDPEKPDKCACRYFRNTVHLENNIKVLERIMAEEGLTRYVNLTSHWTDENAFLALLKRRACHTSAILLKNEEKKK